MTSDETSPSETVIPLMEETVRIDIRERITGRTRVTTRTETRTEDVEARVESHDVEVTRVPVGRDLDPGEPVPGPREVGDTTVVPVLEEYLFVETRLRLVEEVHIRRVTTAEDVHVPVTLRRQVAEIEHVDVPADETNPPTPLPLKRMRIRPMAYDDTRTVSAFYDTRASADAHKQALEDLGVSGGDITIVEGADEAEPDRAYEEKGFFESIGDFIMGDEDREVYNEGLKRGGYLLTARVAAEHYEQALDVLDTDEAVDLDARTETWRSEGWDGVPAAASTTGYAATGATPAGGMADTTPRDGDLADGTIEVMEESVRIGKRDVSHGRVRVRSYMVEDQVSEDVTLRSEHVDIERRPVDRAVAPGEAVFEDRVIEAEETVEEAVVTKETRVVEEIDLKKRSDTETETVTETVRHTEVEIEDDRDGSDTIRRDDRDPI